MGGGHLLMRCPFVNSQAGLQPGTVNVEPLNPGLRICPIVMSVLLSH